MKYINICAVLALLLLGSCDKCNKCKGDHSGTLKNLTGLDGCGWVIQLDGSDDKLEPVNLNKFDIELEDGEKVNFSYKETEGGSICMVGKVVELTVICEAE